MESSYCKRPLLYLSFLVLHRFYMGLRHTSDFRFSMFIGSAISFCIGTYVYLLKVSINRNRETDL
jgi:hypothetical protein